jgi:hypothetical protein
MELQELKKTWNKLSSNQELDEDQIREMLRRKTNNLIDRINRNVRIGFVLLLAFILLFLLDDFVFYPMLTRQVEAVVRVPQWLIFLSLFSNTLILITFIYFAIKYYLVKKDGEIMSDLRESLKKIIAILNIYQRLFYLALFILSLAITLQFLNGMFTGMAYGMEIQGIPFSEVSVNRLLLATAIGILILAGIVGGVFFIMRWGFRRLYGNYIRKLKLTLQELDEINHQV